MKPKTNPPPLFLPRPVLLLPPHLPLLLLHRPDDDAVARALDEVGLAGLGERLPQTLSGGQQQRVAIARALVHTPKLILADEPVASLDPASSRQVMELLAGLNRELGVTVLVVLLIVNIGKLGFLNKSECLNLNMVNNHQLLLLQE